jgi:hypothetical protein
MLKQQGISTNTQFWWENLKETIFLKIVSNLILLEIKGNKVAFNCKTQSYAGVTSLRLQTQIKL